MVAQTEFETLFNDSMSNVDMTPGSIVSAKVIEIRDDYVIINAGLKSEGIIPKNQFLDASGKLEINLGDEVEVTLDIIEDGYGETIMSREKAKRTKVWTELEKIQKNIEKASPGRQISRKIHILRPAEPYMVVVRNRTPCMDLK